jgi:hypothetical protein
MFHVAAADKTSVNKIVSENIAQESRLLTDESRLYGDAPTLQDRREVSQRRKFLCPRIADLFLLLWPAQPSRRPILSPLHRS